MLLRRISKCFIRTTKTKSPTEEQTIAFTGLSIYIYLYIYIKWFSFSVLKWELI